MLTEHVVICLGGGVESDGKLPNQAALRVEKGVEVAMNSGDSVLIMSSSFTLNVPPRMTADGLIISEASAMARAAKALGYAGQLFCEQQSHDTIGSAYFLFSDFLSFLTPQHVTVITSDFHVARAEIIFVHMASLFDYHRPMSFIAIPAEVNAERCEHEGRAADSYIQDWGEIVDLDAFRHRFFSHHANYNVVFASDAMSAARASSY